MELDRGLISALVERWRQETHTFHLTIEEASITLQDTAVILGLPIHRHAVIGHGEGEWTALVWELLGVFLENPQDPTKTKIIIGSSLKLTWLRDRFRVLGQMQMMLLLRGMPAHTFCISLVASCSQTKAGTLES